MNTPALKLLAMLEDEKTLEALSAEEVRGDLIALGVDPANAIAFARALAGSTSTPGGQLLGAIDAAEEAEAEIARIEATDIGDVRAQIPEGTAAAIAAEARRKAGIGDNVVGMAVRRRSRVLRWGGPFAGIAASVLLVFLVGRSYLSEQASFESAKAPESEVAMADRADRAAEPSPDTLMKDLAGPALGKAEEKAQPAPSLRAERSIGGTTGAGAELPEQAGERLARTSPGDADTSRDKSVAAAPAAEDETARGLLDGREARPAAPAKQSAGTAAEPSIAAAPPVATAPAQTESFAANAEAEADTGAKFDRGYGAVAKPAATEGVDAEQERQETDMVARARAPGEPRIAAVYYTDWSQAPAAIQSQVLPIGGLDRRLEEARMLAGERPVIALFTVESAAGRQDFAQVPLRPAMTQQMMPPPPVATLLGPDAAQFDFIALP